MFKNEELIKAARNGDEKIVKTLLENGANVNHANQFGYTALMWAANNGHLEIVKTLLANGANIKAVNKYGETALTLAKSNGHLEIVKILETNNILSNDNVEKNKEEINANDLQKQILINVKVVTLTM